MSTSLVPTSQVIPLDTVVFTGITGLTLGDGLSWLLRSLRATYDRLTEVSLVTADGGEITVDDSSHSDAMWALKGSREGLGIVTQFQFETTQLRETVCGTLRIPTDDSRTYRSFSNLAEWMV